MKTTIEFEGLELGELIAALESQAIYRNKWSKTTDAQWHKEFLIRNRDACISLLKKLSRRYDDPKVRRWHIGC